MCKIPRKLDLYMKMKAQSIYLGNCYACLGLKTLEKLVRKSGNRKNPSLKSGYEDSGSRNGEKLKSKVTSFRGRKYLYNIKTYFVFTQSIA